MEDLVHISPVTDQALRNRLRLKLKEYRERIAGDSRGNDYRWKYKRPDLAMKLYDDYREYKYREFVLTRVLRADSALLISDLRAEAARAFEHFDANVFTEACTLVATYAGQTNLQVSGGTGFPEQSQ